VSDGEPGRPLRGSARQRIDAEALRPVIHPQRRDAKPLDAWDDAYIATIRPLGVHGALVALDELHLLVERHLGDEGLRARPRVGVRRWCRRGDTHRGAHDAEQAYE
jgi:hypothetical protein